jgi:hypothetical protein
MTESDTTGEERLRQMFRQAAVQIHPSTPGPGFDTLPPRTPRATTMRRSLGVALCVAVAGAVTLAAHPWGNSQGTGLGDGTGSDGVLVAVASNGAIELLSPDSGAVLSTLVGPSPVDTSGRHLRQPLAITADAQFAYVGYEFPSPVIESIPMSGGTPTYVTAGLDPSVSPDGSKLAYQPAESTSTGDLVVRDLTTGSQQTVDSSSGITFGNELSWSPDGTELALSGTFLSTPPKTLAPGTLPNLITEGVQLLALNQPLSATNPRFVGTPVGSSGLEAGSPVWSDAQFLGSTGAIVVVQSGSGGGCQAAPSSLLSVNPTTGNTTAVASFPYLVSDPIFDQAGNLVAFQRSFVSCTPPVTTTSTTSTTTTTSPGSFGGSASTGGAFATSTAWTRSVLYKWSNGTASRLGGDVRAVTFVDRASGAES